MASLARPYAVSVVLYFAKEHGPRLRSLAARDWPKDAYGDPSIFPKAARAAENATGLLIQCGSKEELQEIAAFFTLHSVPVLRMEEVRL